MKNNVMKDLQDLIDRLSVIGYKGVEHLIALIEDKDPEFKELAPNVVTLLEAVSRIEKREEDIAKKMHKAHMLHVIKEAEDTIEMIELALKNHNSSANTKLLKKLNQRFKEVIQKEHEEKWIPKP